MPPTLIMLVGLPASGKTTVAKEMISNSQRATKRVSKVDLIAMLDMENQSRDSEVFAKAIEKQIVVAALDLGYDVVVDDLNLKISDENYWTKTADENGATFVRLPMEATLESCIERDSQREHPVGKDRIIELYLLYSKELNKTLLKGQKE